ncbi:MAG: phage terminase large subunit family protein, partial [Pseudomonadota bacterium]|nr:phage terminase large subunit family protein [Pseudomonadota bacterium]
NQIRAKRFKGGWIQIKGTNSPKEFRRVTADKVLLEEPDGYPHSAGVEGDPAALAFKRCLTSDEPLKAAGSTPSIEGLSRIDGLFVEGTQEHRYVPCPTCGDMQVLVFGDGSGTGIRWSPRERPTTVWYQCVTGCKIPESRKAWMDENGEWRAHNPEAGPLHRSFHIWAAYSQHQGAAWLEVAKEFLAVRKDPNRLKVFVNQVLGLSWAEKGEAPEWERLYNRREPSMQLGTVPNWAGLIVGSVDVQRGGGGRLEMDVWAFGQGRRRALVEHIEVDGSIAEASTWAKLDAEVAREWQTQSGRMMRLTRVGIDSGDGLNTMYVYAWARRHPGFAMALKGRDAVAAGQPIAGPKWMDVTLNGKKMKRGVRLWTVGTSMLKLELYGNLELERPVDGEEYPEGYVFLPDGTTDEWVKQLVAEQMKRVAMRNGRTRSEWVQSRDRNEAIDNAIYARAVAIALGVDRWTPGQWAMAIGDLTPKRPARKPKVVDPSPPPDRDQPTSGQPVRAVNPLTRRPRGSFLQRKR